MDWIIFWSFGPPCFPYADKLTLTGSFFFFLIQKVTQRCGLIRISSLQRGRARKAGQETRLTPHRRTDGGADEWSIGDCSG